MLKSILTATINAQSTNNGLFLPLSFSYEQARVMGILSANKADAERLMSKVDAELTGADDQTPTDEEFYKKMEKLVSTENKFHFPLELTLVIVRETGAILILNWGGSVILRRKGKIAQLTSTNDDQVTLEVKAGKLKKGDILTLSNSSTADVLERVKENLETAKDWTDFVLFSQAYFSQINVENKGLLILKIKNETETGVEHMQTTPARETPNENFVSGARIIAINEKSLGKEDMFGEAEKIEQEMYYDGQIGNQVAQNEAVESFGPEPTFLQQRQFKESEIEADWANNSSETKNTPWNKISGFFKKKT